MTTILIISAYIIIVIMVFANIKRFKENRELLNEIEVLQSNSEFYKKRYDFIFETAQELDKKNIELRKKANKYDKELERQRIKNANYRAKKTTIKIK